jgi:hypothetical protein
MSGSDYSFGSKVEPVRASDAIAATMPPPSAMTAETGPKVFRNGHWVEPYGHHGGGHHQGRNEKGEYTHSDAGGHRQARNEKTGEYIKSHGEYGETTKNGNTAHGPLPPHHPTGTTVQQGAPARPVETIRIPVRFQWNPSDGKPPVQTPLLKPLEKAGHPLDNVVLTKIELLATSSNAPGTLKGTLANVHTTDSTVATGCHEGHRHLVTTEGDRFAYLIPPGYNRHNEVLFDNPIPVNQTIDLATHAGIKSKTLREGVIDFGPESTHVQVNNLKSPELYAMIDNNRGMFKTLAHGTAGNSMFFVISRDELNAFLEDYDRNVQSSILRTNPAEHQASLATWAVDDNLFGQTVANSAPMVNGRDAHLHPETSHEVVAVLQYSYLPVNK